MFSVVVLALLVVGFVVLVVTFFWVSRLLAIRASENAARNEPADADQGAAAPGDGGDKSDLADVAEETTTDTHNSQKVALGTGAEGTDSTGARAAIQGATLGLILGILACALFTVSELMIILSGGAIFYSGRALYYGLRRYVTIIWRALLGFLLGVVSLGLHYLSLSGQLSVLISPL